MKPSQLIALLVSLTLAAGCFDSVDRSSRARADKLSQENRYQEAIAEYQRHIQKRLAVKNRPEWENPYLYLLDIGDVYLKQGDVQEALKQYEAAEEQGVKQGYVNDRYRAVADWYEERGELKQAFEHMKRYRDKDPLLFDIILDRIARRIAAEGGTAAGR